MKTLAFPEPVIIRPHSYLLRDLLLLPILASVFLLDQLSKYFVRGYMELGESIPAQGFLRLTHTTNSGGAFGVFPDQTLFLTAASFVCIAVLFLFYRTYPGPGRLVRLSLGLQLGGALGNLIDRLRSGEVVDFIDVGIWPIFNVADSSIVIGITLLAGIVLFAEREPRAPLPSPLVPSYSYRHSPPEMGC